MLRADCRKCDGKMKSLGVTTTNELVFYCSSCRTLFTIGYRGQWTEYPMKTSGDMLRIKRDVKMQKASRAKPHAQVA